MSAPHGSYPDLTPEARERERIEPLALVIAVLPLIGIVGGLIALVKGKKRTGGRMILIGIASFVALGLVR